MKIHFVCTGNVYRSRLAEAYLNSKQLPNIEADSSGIFANENYEFHGPIYWSAMRLIDRKHLAPFMSRMSTQTTLDLLHSADLIIFLKGNHHEFSKNELGFIKENYEIWDIPDLDDEPNYDILSDENILRISERTFTTIQEKVDDLVERLSTVKSY